MQTVNVIVLAFTLCAVVWYTFETRKLRIANDLMLKLQLKNVQPRIVACLDRGPTFFDTVFMVRNIGGSPALQIRAEITPTWKSPESSVDKLFNKDALFNAGVSIIFPNHSYEVFAGFVASQEERSTEEKIPDNYKVKIHYQDEIGNKYSSESLLNLEEFTNRLNSGRMTKLESIINEIEKSIKTLVDYFVKSGKLS